MTRTAVHTLLAFAAAITLAACGGESPPPTGPTPPTPSTPRSLAISPDTAFLKVNQTETFSGTLTMSDGQTQSVQPTWQSDNTSVLTFDGGGTARGLRNGTATITASNQGLSTTRLIRVAPDYQGTWAGDYVVVRCDATAEYRAADFCHPERGFAVGRLLAVFFAFTQQRESISGDMDLGALEGTASGSLDGNGQLTGSGNAVFTAEGVPVVFAVGPLVLNADGNRLTGRFTVTMTIAGVPGQGVFDADIKTVTRMSSSTASTLGTRREFGSLRESFRAAQRR
jgi:Big-like domain-containing protein